MLVLSRRLNEKLRIGPHIQVTVIHCRRGVVKLGIEAPRDIEIVRAKADSAEGKEQSKP